MGPVLVPPVHRLPPEILRDIFRLLDVDRSYAFRHHGAPPLTYLSHVCRKWRHVALDMQELWNSWPRYRTADENWTLLCCSRARTTPLDLEWTVGASYRSDELNNRCHSLVRHTLPHASRARTLVINIDADFVPSVAAFWRDEVLPVLSMHFPLLEDFSYMPNIETSNDEMRIITPSIFSGVYPPHLRKMFLSSCEALQTCPIYSANLQHLHLYSARAWTDVDGMIRLFQSIPNLETFEYSLGTTEFDDDYVYDPTPSLHHPLRAVAMNRLKSFKTIQSRFVHGITILCYLALPPDANISFWWTDNEEAEEMEAHELTQAIEHMRLGSEALNQHFVSAVFTGMQPFRAVEIAGTCVRPLHVEEESADATRAPPSLSLTAPLVDTREMLLRAEPCLLTALQPIFLQATYLRLKLSDLHDIHDTEQWIALWVNLYQYQKVTDLHLFGKNVVWFFDYLVVRLNPEFPASTPALFPLLENITVSDFDFTKARRTRDGDERPFGMRFGDVVNRIFGGLESFGNVWVGHTCKGHGAAVEQLRMCLGDDRVESDDEV
ncbi:hypothetical protein PENSPDRAFT_685600 [Peniophora sp. CONT]|nr:hypothetical protein PENSPDRAFT_685600 [Peniophora sp. CONT]